MQSARIFKKASAYSFAAIAIGFAMTSLAYLAWLYRLMDFVEPQTADIITMVCGYLMQAAGVGLHALMRFRRGAFASGKKLGVLIGVYALLAAGATLPASLPAIVACGLAMNLLCGFIAGYYLCTLVIFADRQRYAIAFGGAYCLASAAQWLAGLPAGGALLRAPDALAVHSVLAIAFAYLVVWEAPEERGIAAHPSPLPDNLLPLSCGTVLLLSLVKNLGFAFPAEDLASGVSLELSRLFYAVGLIVAGFISDRSRRYGAISCLAACITPFALLALGRSALPATVLWGLDYFLYGFFTVFRVVLFADIAERSGRVWLAGFGLMLGRIGDAVGTLANIALADRPVALVMMTSLIFIMTVFPFFRLYQSVYAPVTDDRADEGRRFDAFAARYGLSTRERGVLRALLDERSNSEIAAALFVSESTVKFHVHNLLKKTSCANRLELLALFSDFDVLG